MKLTDSQRRHVVVLLAQVEDAVEALERLSTDPLGERVLRVEKRDLPEGFGQAVRGDLSEVRLGLAEMASPLQLEPLQQSRAQAALGLLSIAIVQLEEAGSRGLRGYGDVDPDLPAVLDSALRRLRGLLARVAEQLTGARKRDPSS